MSNFLKLIPIVYYYFHEAYIHTPRNMDILPYIALLHHKEVLLSSEREKHDRSKMFVQRLWKGPFFYAKLGRAHV